LSRTSGRLYSILRGKGEILIFLQTRKTLGDRAFVTYVQFFLHKWGEVTLGHLHIKLPENGDVPIVIVNENDRMPLPLADMPIPQNVKKFKSIRIRFVFTTKVIPYINKLKYYSAITTHPSLLFSKNFSEIPC
jgi:hypothetical protein